MNKPSNWYQMSCDEQRAWSRQEREREDLEYERDRLRDEAERNARDCRREAESRRAMESDHRCQIEALSSSAEEAEAELRICMGFIQDKSLEAEYDDYAAYRRKT